jgi:hypothetical protein
MAHIQQIPEPAMTTPEGTVLIDGCMVSRADVDYNRALDALLALGPNAVALVARVDDAVSRRLHEAERDAVRRNGERIMAMIRGDD